MNEPQSWSPPGWARLFAYLVGVALFPGHIALLGGINFPFLALDSIVLIGLSPDVFKQFSALILGMFGKSNQVGPAPPSGSRPPKAGSNG